MLGLLMVLLLAVIIVLGLNVGELVALVRMLRVVSRLFVESLGCHPAASIFNDRLTAIVPSMIGVRLVPPDKALVIVYNLLSLPSALLAVKILPFPTLSQETLLFPLPSTADEEDDRTGDEKGERDTDADKC